MEIENNNEANGNTNDYMACKDEKLDIIEEA